jgi:competence protein ComEC
MLYDAGHFGAPAAARRTVSGYLWSQGITHLDAIIISHADADHYNAVADLLTRFVVGAVYVSPMMFSERSARGNAALEALRGAMDAAGVRVVEVSAGRGWRSGEASMTVLHPPAVGVPGSDNANSIVLAAELAGRRLLLTGDLESPGLERLMTEGAWARGRGDGKGESEGGGWDVMLAPHHGSPRSSPPQFAKWTAAAWAVVSGSERDDMAAVRESYRAAGTQVLHTAEDGAVQATFRRGSVRVQTYRVPGDGKWGDDRGWRERSR